MRGNINHKDEKSMWSWLIVDERIDDGRSVMLYYCLFTVSFVRLFRNNIFLFVCWFVCMAIPTHKVSCLYVPKTAISDTKTAILNPRENQQTLHGPRRPNWVQWGWVITKGDEGWVKIGGCSEGGLSQREMKRGLTHRDAEWFNTEECRDRED